MSRVMRRAAIVQNGFGKYLQAARSLPAGVSHAGREGLADKPINLAKQLEQQALQTQTTSSTKPTIGDEIQPTEDD